MNKIIEELKWRGLYSEGFGPIAENLQPGQCFYVGTDPTADSLGVHHMIAFIVARILKHNGLKPIVLVGQATASLGDPSFKKDERKIIPMDQIEHNTHCIEAQLRRIIGDDVTFVNNYDWMSKISFLDFMRDIGKHITVNYMMSKESVKQRLSREGTGLSFCEFSYSNIQAYDFLYLYQHYGCKIQIGGKDQTGNMDSAFELARKRNHITDLSSFVWDLITDSTGKKFGKSEGNAVWLDPKKTSPYSFMQFWINQSDADAEKFAKMFLPDMTVEEIQPLIDEHKKTPSKRLLQKTLAREMTLMVHGEDAYNKAVAASNILFGKSSTDDLEHLDADTFASVMRDVPKVNAKFNDINGVNVADFLCDVVHLGSKTEIRKLIKAGGLSINKMKVNDVKKDISDSMILKNDTMLIQKGKKKYTLVQIARS